METFPFPGWRSVNEKGQLPPGTKPFGKLPPGVTPAIQPEDRERLIHRGDIVTVPTNIEPNKEFWSSGLDKKNDWLIFGWTNVVNNIRQMYNSFQLFDTEPCYHIRPNKIPDIWDCDVTDVLCHGEADRRAVNDQKVEFYMIRTISSRLATCHRQTSAMEYCEKARNMAYDVQCGALEETLREMEAAFELKWGRINRLNIHMHLGRAAYFKQKNRYIEDRFRHRMMENVGAKANTDFMTEDSRWRIDGPDQREFDPTTQKSVTETHHVWGDFANPRKWNLDQAMLIEANKRRKAREQEAE